MSVSTSVRAAVLLASALGAGCAAFFNPSSLPLGSKVSSATEALGRPTGEYPLADGGKRLEFARGPFGKHTWMLDYDASGGLKTVQQVLTEANFNAIRAGMSSDDLLRTLGRPSETSLLSWQRQTVWSYRYDAIFCQWFQVGIDQSGKVVDSAYGPDPLCDKDFDLDVGVL
jgi:hypothetical protein